MPADSRRRALLVGVCAPLIIAVLTAGVLALWYPRLPDPVATHWGAAGPDGLTPARTLLFLAPALIAGSSLPTSAVVLFHGRSSWSRTHRVLLGLSAGVAVLLSCTVLLFTYPQRDLPDGAHAPVSAGPSLVLALLVGACAWALATLAAPASVHTSATGRKIPAAPTAGAPGEWSATILPDAPMLIFVSIALAPLVIMTAWMAVAGSDEWWILALILLGTVLLLASFLAFRIRIDAAGLEARSMLGWPRIRVPAAEIASVEVATIDPLGDFGGWGLRWGRRRLGIVLRSGEGLLITRTDGRLIGITLDDAEAAGATLASHPDVRLGR